MSVSASTLDEAAAADPFREDGLEVGVVFPLFGVEVASGL